jgi:hypothetical protein
MFHKKIAENQLNLDNMDGHEFEALIEELIKKMGFSVDERKLTADGGVDILAHSHETLYEGKYVVQCKRYSQKVPESPVRDLYGVVHSLNANKGILITNSTFTHAAVDFAKDKQIELIDGTKLRSLFSRYNLFRKEPGFAINEATTYLFNTFLPKIKKQKQIFDELKSSYFERRRIPSQQYVSMSIAIVENNGDFEDWWNNIMPNFISILHDKPLDYQRLNQISEQIIKGLQAYFKNYKSFLENIPPDVFFVSYEKIIICFEEFTEKIFGMVNEIDRISNLPTDRLKERMDSEGVVKFNYSIKISKQSLDSALQEFERACRSARGR